LGFILITFIILFTPAVWRHWVTCPRLEKEVIADALNEAVSKLVLPTIDVHNYRKKYPEQKKENCV